MKTKIIFLLNQVFLMIRDKSLRPSAARAVIGRCGSANNPGFQAPPKDPKIGDQSKSRGMRTRYFMARPGLNGDGATIISSVQR